MVRDEFRVAFRWRLCLIIAANISMSSFSTRIVNAGEIKKTALSSVHSDLGSQTDYRKLWGEHYVQGLHSLNWNQSIGWNGLVPGKSSIGQVIEKLGQPDATERDALGWNHYSFSSCIAVMVYGTDPIASIEVYPSKKYLANFPLTVHDAKLMYGPIERRLKMEGDVTEAYLGRPGLTITIDSDKDAAQVNYMRFLAPDHGTDKKSK
jgi:hypothetical protein